MKYRKKNEKVNRELKNFSQYVDMPYNQIKRENKENLFNGYEKFGWDDYNVYDLITSPYDYVYNYPLSYLMWKCSWNTIDEKVNSSEFKEICKGLNKITIELTIRKAKKKLKDDWYFLIGCRGAKANKRKRR